MCQTFIPLLAKDGRIVNVSSTGSSLGQYSKEIQQRFRSSKMTLDDLEGMMQEYQVVKAEDPKNAIALIDIGMRQKRNREPIWMAKKVI